MNKFPEEWGETLKLFLDGEGYLSIPEKCRRLKIDVGLSWSAIHAISWLEEDEELFCIGFEPLEENLMRLKDLMSNNPRYSGVADRFLVIPCALSDEDKVVTFFSTTDPGQSSLLEPIKFPLSAKVQVPAFKLDTVLSIVKPSRFPVIDAIKTDCQGADLLVLRGGRETLKRTAVVVTEAESINYRNASNSVQRLEAFLSDLGFIYFNKPTEFQLTYRERLRWLDKPVYRWVILLASHFREFLSRFQSNKASSRIRTVDPTFVNSKYIDAVNKGEIFVHQWN